jgi:hypothetical protein
MNNHHEAKLTVASLTILGDKASQDIYYILLKFFDEINYTEIKALEKRISVLTNLIEV